MGGSQPILMRAFRSINGSFHTWRAGSYDPGMAEATGAQTPPFPIGEYSDHMVLGFLGGPLARSDSTSFAPVGLGTVGVPVVFPAAATPLVETSPGTDCQDFTSISYWVTVTTLGGGATVTVRALWGMEASPAVTTDYGFQASDDQIATGTSPQAIYEGVYALSVGILQSFGPFNVPVRGRYHRLSVSSDNGLVQGFVRAIRLA